AWSACEDPLRLGEDKRDELSVEKVVLRGRELDIGDWRALLHRIKTPSHEVAIGVVGKYIDHNDAYKSVYEALVHAGISLSTRVLIRKIEAEQLLARDEAERILSGMDGILVPGGFGYRGIDGKVQAIRYAR